MKKTYINPKTSKIVLELQSMVAVSTGSGGGGVNNPPKSKDFEIDNYSPSSPKLWDEEE